MFILILPTGLNTSLLLSIRGRDYKLNGAKANIENVIDHLIKAGLVNQGASARSLKDAINHAWKNAEDIKAHGEPILVNSRRHCLNVFMDLLELISSPNSRYVDLDSTTFNKNDTKTRGLTFLSNSEVFVVTFTGRRLSEATPILEVEIESKSYSDHKLNLLIGYDTKGHKGNPPFCHLDISSNDNCGKWVKHCKLNGVWGTPKKVNNFIDMLFLLLDRKAIAQSRMNKLLPVPQLSYFEVDFDRVA